MDTFADATDDLREAARHLVADWPPLTVEQINVLRKVWWCYTLVDGEWVKRELEPLPVGDSRPRAVVSLRKSRVCVYRHWDDEGTLLYIGITDTPVSRTQQHGRSSPWVSFSARAEVRWYANREIAMKVERAAIKSERPLFNAVHADGNRDARLVEYLVKRGRWDLIKPGV